MSFSRPWQRSFVLKAVSGLSLVLLLLSPACEAKVELPMWFGDNMVFQVNAEYGARSFLNG
eukprot:COSAG02_NODE_34259_length_486_cov_69.223932_1_plen_60_part_10